MAETISELKVAIGADLSKLSAQLSSMESKIGKAGKSSASSFGSAMAGLAKTVATVFSVQAIVAFERKIIELGSEFQKFEAILTTSLGDNSLAAGAMVMIQDFASKTPFSVRELTDSFVKLTNQGFKPTEKELRKLGDLASSTGKNFDQLAEALIDAQVGEFERLKEFGVKAQTEGDKVKFTFKGVTTEVDKTSASIKNYILSLGDIEGVSGSMAAISNTLGGSISNLGDSFDQLLVTLSNTQGGLYGFFTGLSEAIQGVTAAIQAGGLISGDDQLFGRSAGNVTYQSIIDQFGKLEKKYGDTASAIDKLKEKSAEFQKLSEGDNTPKMTYYYLKQAEAYNKAALELTKLNMATASGKVNLEEQAKALEAWTKKAEAASLEAKELGESIIDSMIDMKFTGLYFPGKSADMKVQPVEMDEEEGEYLPGSDEFVERLARQQEGFEFMQNNAEMLGGAFQSAFDAALISGESFSETLGKSLEGLIQKLVSAVITASALSLIFSAFGIGSFAGNFKSMFSQFGGFEFGLDGNDLVTSGSRTNKQIGRSR
jgi:hypothetical protein